MARRSGSWASSSDRQETSTSSFQSCHGRSASPRATSQSPNARPAWTFQNDWLNNGSIQLGEVLPAGWRERVQRIFEGQALVLSTLGRLDLLKSKLFALCDRGTDLPDCIALAPAAEELGECVPWLEARDGNELWPARVRATVADLARRLGHGV